MRGVARRILAAELRRNRPEYRISIARTSACDEDRVANELDARIGERRVDRSRRRVHTSGARLMGSDLCFSLPGWHLTDVRSQLRAPKV